MKNILKMLFGGNFKSKVYVKGGSLESHEIIVGKKYRTKNGDVLTVKDFEIENHITVDDGKGKLSSIGIQRISVFKDLINNGELIPLNENGGNFQSGVYAVGGSLQAHGIESGDTFLNTISGAIQKVKDKNGKIVYINLANGERSSQPPLPYNRGGSITNERKHVNKDEDYEVRYSKPRPARKGYKGLRSFKDGGSLVGNQKRIDMNKNGKIDAEDFKLLRASMNGAWRNERKHVNHNEDYEVRYAKPRPNRTGYKGKRKFGEGGGISNFERLSRVVAKNYEGKRVKPQYQKEYGKVYSKSEAKEVGNKVAGKMKMMKKAESGAEVKKGNRDGVMVLAKKIRKEGESWKDALKRAGQQLK